jgi:ABC-type glycerol-3-phosphate transport system permease component
MIAVAAMLIALFATLAPLAWALFGSLKTEAEYRQIPITILPRTVSLAGYTTVLSDGRIPRAMLNSATLAAIEVSAVLLTSSLAGYVFARKMFWGKDALFLFVLASTMVPFSMLLIPLYLMFVHVGLTNNYVGVVLPTAVSAYGIFLCRQFIRGIPRDLFDAAMVDGASDVRIYRLIILPLCRPVLSALAILTLIASLNSLLWPLVVLDDRNLATVPLVLATYARSGETAVFTEALAAALLASLPLLVAFLLLQRQFVKGISLTGLGGR